MKIIWDDDLESRDINKRVNDYNKKNKIERNNINEQLEKTCHKNIAIFPRPVILKNIKINNAIHDKLIFTSAIIFSREKVPPDCLKHPKIYKISILKYDKTTRSAILFVKKR